MMLWLLSSPVLPGVDSPQSSDPHGPPADSNGYTDDEDDDDGGNGKEPAEDDGGGWSVSVLMQKEDFSESEVPKGTCTISISVKRAHVISVMRKPHTYIPMQHLFVAWSDGRSF